MCRRFVVLFAIWLVPSMVWAETVPSKIDAVVVYPGGATVTRVARVSLNAGTNEVRLAGLVDSLDPDRVRVEVRNAAVRIGQIQLEKEQQRDVLDAESNALQAKIDTVTDKIRAVEDNIAAAKLQQQFLSGIASGYSQDAGFEASRGAADVASWRAALQLLSTASRDTSESIRKSENEQKELSKDLSVLKRELATLRGGALASTTVLLTLTAESPVQTQINLMYFLEDAYWSPRYEARLDSDSGELQLAQQAAVRQATNEAWNGVKLTLSTSEPGGDLVAPTLDPEFLNLYSPAPRRELKRMMSQGVAGIAADSLEEVTVTGSKVRPDVGSFAVSYDIPGRTSVSNDSDDDVILDLANYRFDADLVTEVVPRSSTQAFLTARFIDDRSVPLYGSQMSVYVDGAYAGVSDMPTALPQAEIVLPMGQDRRIGVTAETQGGADGEGGLVSRRKTETTDYLFEITNRRATPSYVEVRDLYPVARNKDIDVDVPRSATPPDERDLEDQPGLILWKKELAPGEAWRIRHQYSISYPAKMRLSRE